MEHDETYLKLAKLGEKVAYMEEIIKEIKEASVTHSDMEVLKVGISNVEKAMKEIKFDLLPLRDYPVVRRICFSTIAVVLCYVVTIVIKAGLS